MRLEGQRVKVRLRLGANAIDVRKASKTKLVINKPYDTEKNLRDRENDVEISSYH